MIQISAGSGWVPDFGLKRNLLLYGSNQGSNESVGFDDKFLIWACAAAGFPSPPHQVDRNEIAQFGSIVQFILEYQHCVQILKGVSPANVHTPSISEIGRKLDEPSVN